MINKFLYQYKLSKIKRQITKELILSFSLYSILFISFIISEIIFYHSPDIRYKLFILLTTLPIVIIFYIIIKLMVNLKSVNHNMSDEKLAKELGTKIPKLSDRILNILQLTNTNFKNKTKNELSKIAIESLDKDLKKENLNQFAPQISLYKSIFLTIIICFNFILIASLNETRSSFIRIYKYAQSFPPPTPFIIKSQNNLDGEYPSGINVPISFLVQNKDRPPNLMLHWIGNSQHDSLILNLNRNGEYEHIFYNLQNNISYWASYKAKSFFSAWDTIGTTLQRIKIIKRPDVEDIEFQLIPPKYTKLNPQILKGNSAQITSITGSILRCKIKSNQHLNSAIIINNRLDTLFLKPLDSGYWEAEFNIAGEQSIEFAIFNQHQLKNEPPLLYKIKELEDFPPEIYVTSPLNKSLEINNQSTIPVSFKINDDYGLKNSWIEYNIIKPNYTHADSSTYFLLLNQYLDTKSYNQTYKWKLDQYNLFPGDQINFRIVAKDNNPNEGITKTGYYHMIYPSFENIFSTLESKEEDIKDMSYEIIDQINDIDTMIEDMELDLLKAATMNWEHQQKAEESLKKMDDIFSEIEDMQKAIEDLQEQAEKGNVIDDELMGKFDQFQELLDSIMTPELMEALQKMQEAIQKMDLEQMLQATENFDYNLEQFEQQLDRFIEMFELAIAEQKMEELIAALDLMVNEQTEIESKVNEGVELQMLASMQNRQNENFENLQQTMKETKQSIEKFSEQSAKGIEELMNSELNAKTKQSLNSSKQKLSDNDNTAINDITKSKENLEEMYKEAQNIQELFKEESVKEMMEIFYATIRNILKLSEYEEELTLNFENIKFSSPKIRTFTFQQFIIGKQFTKFVEQLMELSTKTFYITPSINKKIGFCKKTIDSSIINLEQRKVSTAINEQKKILASMNEIALLLISAMDEMQNTGSASGLESYLEQLEAIGQGQSQVNMGTMQLGQMGMLSQQEMMKRLQSQQKSLQKQLEQILEDCSGGAPGGLSKAAEDMESVLQDFQRNKVSKETEKKQQKILSRLLDSQKSLKQREFSEKRKGSQGENAEYTGPINIPENLGQNNLLFIDAMEEALDQNYSEEYEKMFKKYYRELYNDEVR